MKKKLLIGLTIVMFIFTMNNIAEALSINPNVTLSGTASQSSTLCIGDFHASADLTIDGNTDGNFWNESVSHTYDDVGPYAWWELNLGERYIIDEINIWNRTDGIYDGLPTGERLFPFTLSVLEYDRDVAWSHSITSSQNNPLVFSLPDITGQFVRVQLDRQSWLQLAEVEVFAKPVSEPATMLLLGSGLAGLGLYRKKRKSF